ncbi:hypothetical protein WJX77_010448 [Trebouxia sp. C0004]
METFLAELDQQELLPVGKAIVHGKYSGPDIQPASHSRNAGIRQQQLDLLGAAVSRLKQLPSAHASEMYDDAQFQCQMENILLSPNDVEAGNLRNHLPAWHQFFLCFGHTARSKQVLSWIEHGLKFEFVAVHAKSQLQHPRFGPRMQLVEKLWFKTVGRNDVAKLLLGDKPSQVHFANRVSCMHHSDFVRETIQKLLQTGAMKPWEGTAPPMVISGLGVVANRKGKLRLILDCRYLNLYLRYWKLKYERLADVTQYLQQGHLC